MPDMLVTRVRVAQQEEGVCWRGGPAATPAHTLRLCSRAQPCKENGRNGYTKKPCDGSGIIRRPLVVSAIIQENTAVMKSRPYGISEQTREPGKYLGSAERLCTERS